MGAAATSEPEKKKVKRKVRKKINDDIVESILTMGVRQERFPFYGTENRTRRKGEIMDNENNCKHEIH